MFFEAGEAIGNFHLNSVMNRYEHGFGGDGLIIYVALYSSQMEKALQQFFILHSATKLYGGSNTNAAPMPMPMPIPIP